MTSFFFLIKNFLKRKSFLFNFTFSICDYIYVCANGRAQKHFQISHTCVRVLTQFACNNFIWNSKRLFIVSVQAAEAETTYKACVAEANLRQRALEKTKV